eukprot:TRINITY_DN291_c1_g1_i3.p1 TRINITY_DN291_c1_g1~~TRINITY_DN291_c1_g1_i3.p1  ORF type:complete len:1639 (-),score=510.17 TRINITY_DN291_c1_g1_i3:36-4808(-)
MASTTIISGGDGGIEGSRTRYDVLNDGVLGPFQARFPFSFVFVPVLEAMRREAEKLPGSLEEALTRLSLATLPVLSSVSIRSEELEMYLDDCVCMRGVITKVRFAQVVQITRSIVKKHVGGTLQSLPQIHAAFWHNETRLQHTFMLLDTFFDQIGDKYLAAIDTLNSDPSFTLAHLDSALVHIMLDHLAPTQEAWADASSRLQWCTSVTNAARNVRALIQGHHQHTTDKNDTTTAGKTHTVQAWPAHWHRLQTMLFLARVVRDVATPLRMSTGQCLELSAAVQRHGSFDKAMLDSLIAFLQQAAKAGTHAQDKPQGSAQAASSVPQTKVLAHLAQLLEIYLSEFCLDSHAKAACMDPLLRSTLIRIAVDQHPAFEPLPQTYGPSSTSFGSSVLPTGLFVFGGRSGKGKAEEPKQTPTPKKDMLLQAPVSLRRYILRMFLNVQLPDMTAHASDMEAPPCLLLLAAHEAALHEAHPGMEAFAGLKVDLLLSEQTPVTAKLEAVAKMRHFLASFARLVVDAHSTMTRIPVDALTLANSLLSPSQANASKAALQHMFNMRVFLLKHIARLMGPSFAQEVMGSPNMHAQMPWVPTWLEDLRMKRFMRKRHLMSVDPFAMVRGYDKSRSAMRTLLETGDATSLGSLVEPPAPPPAPAFSIGSSGPASKRPAPAKLSSSAVGINPHVEPPSSSPAALCLLALFEEVYMLHTVQASPPEVEKVYTWAGKAPFGEQQRTFLKAFAGNQFSGLEAPAISTDSPAPTPDPAYQLMHLTGATTPDQVSLMSVLVHMAAYVLGHTSQSGWSGIFARLLLAPAGITQLFVPTISDDTRHQLMEVLGGGWYECPNGHSYHVDRCGKPMEKFICPTCGASIGGLDHALDPTNKEATKDDRTVPGYIVCNPVQDVSHSGDRQLSPVGFRVLRLLVHGLLLMSAAVSAKMREDVASAIYARSGQVEGAPAPSDRNVVEYLMSHVSVDWIALKDLMSVSSEDVSVVLHHVINSLDEVVPSASAGLPELTSRQSRAIWERMFEEKFVHPFVGSHQIPTLQTFYKTFAKDDGILGEIRETLDHNSLQNRVVTSQPTLWRYTVPLPATFDELKMQFIQAPENKAKYPVLHLFLTEEEQLRSLQYIRVALEWQRMLCLHFDRRIDREYARTHSVGEVLEALETTHPSEINRWRDAFDGYLAAWNAAWKFVDRFVCMEIPSLFRTMSMDMNTPLCFSLPAERDEGICSLALVRYLVDKHNQFLGRVHDILKARRTEATMPAYKGNSPSKDAQASLAEDEDPHAVATHLLKDADLIVYGGHDLSDVGQMLQLHVGQGLLYGQGTGVNIQYDRIEQHLIDEVLVGRPLINMEVRTFDYSNESRLTGALGHLRQRIPQLELTPDAKQAIMKDLGGLGRVRNAMHVLEICVGFLAATGGTLVQQLPGEIWLADYVRDTLLMGDAPECECICKGSTAISKYTQLQHIVSLWTLLDENLNVDPFKDVHPKYKKALPEVHEVALRGCMGLLRLDVLLPTLKDFILSNLNETGGNLADNIPIKEALGFCEVDMVFSEGASSSATKTSSVALNEMRWFETHFPPTIPMSCCMETYKVLASNPE